MYENFYYIRRMFKSLIKSFSNFYKYLLMHSDSISWWFFQHRQARQKCSFIVFVSFLHDTRALYQVVLSSLSFQERQKTSNSGASKNCNLICRISLQSAFSFFCGKLKHNVRWKVVLTTEACYTSLCFSLLSFSAKTWEKVVDLASERPQLCLKGLFHIIRIEALGVRRSGTKHKDKQS